MAEAGKAKKRPTARKGVQKRTERLRLPFRTPQRLALSRWGFWAGARKREKGRVGPCTRFWARSALPQILVWRCGRRRAKVQQGGASSCAVRLARMTGTGRAEARARPASRQCPNSGRFAPLFLRLLASAAHAGDDQAAGDRVHGQAKDVVVAGFRQDLGDVTLHGAF